MLMSPQKISKLNISNPLRLFQAMKSKKRRGKSMDDIKEDLSKFMGKLKSNVEQNKKSKLRTQLRRYSMINLEYTNFRSRINYNIEHNQTSTLPTDLLKFKQARAIFDTIKTEDSGIKNILFQQNIKSKSQFQMKLKPSKAMLEKMKKRILDKKRKELKEANLYNSPKSPIKNHNFTAMFEQSLNSSSDKIIMKRATQSVPRRNKRVDIKNTLNMLKKKSMLEINTNFNLLYLKNVVQKKLDQKQIYSN